MIEKLENQKKQITIKDTHNKNKISINDKIKKTKRYLTKKYFAFCLIEIYIICFISFLLSHILF